MNREALFRKLLLVKTPVVETSPFELVSSEDSKESGDFATKSLQMVDPGEYSKRLRQYHSQGRRARLAGKLATIGISRHLDQTKAQIRQIQARRELANARTLTFKSIYIHETGKTLSIDGYFDLPHPLPLQIITANELAKAAKSDWYHQSDYPELNSWLMHDKNSMIYGNYAVVPFEQLDEDIIGEAIARWYRCQFDSVQGHWSNREQAIPEIIIDLEWQDACSEDNKHH